MRRKILVIEDEKDVSDLIRDILVRHNIEVIFAYDGIEALEKIQQSPDLVILDLMLPKIDGLEILRRITGDVKTMSIPVIVLTGRSESKHILKATELGAFDYLIKPIKNRDLIDTISKALKLPDAR